MGASGDLAPLAHAALVLLGEGEATYEGRRLSGHDAGLANSIQILYGGSMKGENAAGLLAKADIDGGLIGGASLKAADFLAIADAAAQG